MRLRARNKRNVIPNHAAELFGGSYLQQARRVQGSKQIGLWMLDDAAGLTARNRAPARIVENVEMYDNRGFEEAGAGGADIWLYWTENASDGAITDETVEVHSGSHACKLTQGSSLATYVRPANLQDGNVPRVQPGESVTLSFWTRGDGTNAGRYNIWDSGNGAWIKPATSTGITGTTYQQVTFSFTVPAGCYALYVALMAPNVNGGICYFDDASLIVAKSHNHGQYATSGLTYDQAGIIPGHGAVVANGASTSIRCGSRAWNQIANPNVGSAICWQKVDGAARWTDASEMRYPWHPKARQDITVYMIQGKHTDAHTLFWRRRVASTTFERKYVFSPTGTLDWFCMGFAWDVLSTPKRFAGFLYTHEDRTWQKVFDEEPTAGTGDQFWDLNTLSLDNANCLLLAGGLSSQEWIGSVGPVIEWAGVTLSDNELRKVMIP